MTELKRKKAIQAVGKLTNALTDNLNERCVFYISKYNVNTDGTRFFDTSCHVLFGKTSYYLEFSKIAPSFYIHIVILI